MSNYSQLDAHSRNCGSCLRQRNGGVGPGAEDWNKKKSSLPCTVTRRISDISSLNKMRRSASSLSYSDFGSGGDHDPTSDPSTYLTPTQRKNNEIKRLKYELNKAHEQIHDKNSEITSLRSELCKLKEVLSPDHGESGSIPDSGNCEDHCEDSENETNTRSAMLGIDFELMESTLQEEEESRQQLQAEVEKLQEQQQHFNRELDEQRIQHEEELQVLQQDYNQQLESINKTKNEKLEEVLRELSESTLRCSRQQSIIENHQDMISQQAGQIEDLKAANISLLSDIEKGVKESTRNNANHDATDNASSDRDTSIEITQLRDEIISLQKHLVSSKDTVAALQAKLAEAAYAATQQQQLLAQERSDGGVEKTDMSTQTWRTPGIDNISQVNIEELMQDSPLHPADSGDQGPSTETILLTYQFLRRSVYYFLTDISNRPYHLKSIERLLQFTEGEKQIIDRHKPPPRY